MAMVIRVRFKRATKLYDFDPNGLELHNGMSVVTETARGVELGECMSGVMDVPDERLVLPLKPILRIATEQDLAMQKRNEQAEKEAFDIAIDRIAEHKLEMKLVDVEYAFDRSKNHFLLHRQRPRGFPACWSRVWRAFSRPASSCARSACATRRRCSAESIVRAADLLPDVFERLHAGLHQDGEGAESFAQPDEDFRPVRPSDVLPQIRAGSLRADAQAHAARGARNHYPGRFRASSTRSTCSRRRCVCIAVGDSFELRECKIDDCQRPGQDERKPRPEEDATAEDAQQAAENAEGGAAETAEPNPPKKQEQRPPRRTPGARAETGARP